MCFGGSCTHCGLLGEPCCTSAPACAGGAVCNGVSCQPAGPAVIFSENFEGITWDQFGQGTLTDMIEVWDVGGPQLRTAMLSGAFGSAKALGWYGGGVPAAPSSATMRLPPILDATKTVQLKFDGFSAVGGDLSIAISRAGCPPIAQTISSSNWMSHIVTLPICGVSSKIVFQLGVVYQYTPLSQALKLDNIEVAYL